MRQPSKWIERHQSRLGAAMQAILVLLLLPLTSLCSDVLVDGGRWWWGESTTRSTTEESARAWVGCCCCQCWNTTGEESAEVECRCAGEALRAVPKDLDPQVKTLTIAETGLEVLERDSFKPYRDSLRDVVLMEMSKLKAIEPGIFRRLRHLRTIYISQAPGLKVLSSGTFHGISSSLYTLRIVHTGLQEVPDLHELGSRIIMQMIDLENNGIKEVRSNAIKVKAEQLLLNYNAIESVDAWAFNGSEIAKLSLKGNRQLSELSQDAFLGLKSLREIDLSMTSIIQLPTAGLEELDVLRLEDTTTLKVIPSVYSFKHLREAWLTYSFHCCAFKFPARHNPRRHALHQAYLAKMRDNCNETDWVAEGSVRNRREEQEGIWWSHTVAPDDSFDPYQHEKGKAFGPPFPNSEGREIPRRNISEEVKGHSSDGFFHQTTATLPPKQLEALCGNLFHRKESVQCNPAPDAFNPCEDIMGRVWLRAAVWVVVITSVAGNLSVLLVLLSARFRMSVSKFLMCNLAVADLCMGLYLLLIATMDARTIGVYFNFAFDWQYGPGCKVAGFITVFASQLSIFTLSILTLERWFAITYAMYLNKRLKLPAAAKIMTGGWIYAITMASLPLLGISGYSTTSICLPMETADAADVVYLSALLIANCLAFFLICACYARIYFSLDKETRRGGKNVVSGGTGSTGSSSRGRGSTSRASGEMTVAKRMALLVFTDFACWAPIAFFGLTAVAGMPLIDVTRSKILLVFFYPLNSCANPYLYAILTKQYRRDLFILLSRYGLCKRAAQKYKLSGDPFAIGSGSGRRRGGSRSAGASFEDHRPSLGTIRNELPSPAIVESAVTVQAPSSRVTSLPLQENGIGQRRTMEDGLSIKFRTQEVYL